MTPTQAAAAIETHGGLRAAARASGIAYSTFRDLAGRAGTTAHMPVLEVEPIEDLISRAAKRSQRAAKYRRAMEWVRVDVPESEPFGIMVFGDEHLDDDGCDWSTLLDHIALCRDTPGVYGLGVGDAHNNWIGRLLRLYANQDASAETGWRLVSWLLNGSGVNWLARILGNHDKWGNGADLMRFHNERGVAIFDWNAALSLRMGNGREVRIRAAHDFPGHSMWNRTHGPSKAAMVTFGDADVYLCGHRHTAGVQKFEQGDRVALACRIGSYKRDDDYARVKGYRCDKHGAGMMLIIDPTADNPAGLVECFYDPKQGAKILAALRGSKPEGANMLAASRAPKSGRRRA